MITSTRYAVRLGNGGWSGASRYSYRAGKSTVGDTGFQYAKLFTRKADALSRARQHGTSAFATVVPVTVTLTEDA